MRNTRNSLFTSAVALMLCIVMLAGTTFAWFTDLATSKGNVIQAGKLSAQMHWSDTLLDADSTEWLDASGQAVFTHDNWEPGYTDVKYIKVTNGGDLNFKWKLTVQADGPVTSLSDVIDVYYVNPVTSEITSLEGLTSVGTLTEVLLEKTNSAGSLTPGQSVILAIAFHMDDLAGNEYQNLSLCENGFSLKLLAAQDTGESDSFGDDYDADADWAEGSVNFAASASISRVPMIYGALASDITIGASNGISATLPTGVKVADGATSLDLSVSQVDTDSNITLGEDDSAKSLDVHISGIAADNTVPMIVNLGAILQPGLGDTELKLYHTENDTPVQMTRVNSVDDFAIHNQYTYNDQTGEVSIYVASFSVFSAVQTSADVWNGTSDISWYNDSDTEFTLTTAEQFAGFRELVDGGNTFAGKTIKLGSDIDLNKIPFDPIGFGYYKNDKCTIVDEVVVSDTNTVFLGTFDGGKHTIYNLYQNGWELDPDKTSYSTYTYSTAGAGLFASIKDATIKNLAISGAEVVFECVDMGVLVGYAQGSCHFENIVVTNANIANYNRYTGGLVGEVSYGPYGIDTSKGYSHTFTNIVVDSTVTVSGLWGSFGCGMGGVIGGKWGDATVYMENVISAPTMDVYNDVVSAYQWYAFRGCGMLIGHTEEPYSDGRHAGNATASFLTCENVKVYYGDWVDYTYYQFANQTDAEGNVLWYSNYPWVRAEKGVYCDAFSNIRYGIPLINGVKVTELSEEEFNTAVTSSTKITFDQLYGADRGMYGTNEHDGVTVIRKNVKTVYIHNNENWTNLKLDYWYKNGEDTWTNLLESIDMSEMLLENNVYKIEVPIYAEGFKITAGENSIEFVVSDVANNGFYTLVGEHSHEFDANGDCICGCKKVTVNIAEYAAANGWQNSTQYSSIVANEDIDITCAGGAYTGSLYEGNNWRIYQSDAGKVTITSANGNILSVKIIYEIDKTGTLTLNGSNVASGTVVDVNGASVTFGVGNTGSVTNGQARITDIEVIYTTVLACDHKQTITETKAPTCTEAGYTATKCAECGKVMSWVDGDPATGHDYHGTVTKEANCTESGLTTYTCSKCDSIYTENISAKGHSYNEGVITNEATCTSAGEETFTCATCGDIKTETIAALGHSYTDGTCTVCGEAEPTEPETPTESGWVKTDLADIKSTDIVVIVLTTSGGTSYAISNDKGTSAAPTAVVVTVDGTKLTGDVADKIKWNISNDNGNLTIYPNGTTATWLYCTSANNGVRVGTNANKVFTIDSSSGYLKNTATSRFVGVYTTNPDIRCYTTSTATNIANQTLAFYVYSEGTSGGETPSCEHTNTTTTTTATCTEAGSTTVTCDDCGETVSTEETPATGHTFVDGVCDCGEKESTESEKTTTTVSKSHTDIATIAGVSTSGGSINGKTIKLDDNISIICAKGGSTSNPAIYSESIRLYQGGATLTIKGEGMTQIVITLANNAAGDGPIEVTGGTADNSSAPTNYVYTITVDEGVSEVVITTKGTDKNSRLYVANIEVTYTE